MGWDEMRWYGMRRDGMGCSDCDELQCDEVG
jgi:hypothetical protein